MKKLVLLFLFPICLYAQPSAEFEKTFNESRQLLYFAKFREALPLLLKLDSLDKTNPNINYLIGVSYVASGEDLKKGIERLEFASAHVTNAYRSGQPSEKNAPIYNWYYLGVGYAFTDECEKAEEAFMKFKSYISDPGDSYVADAMQKIATCKDERLKAASQASTVTTVNEKVTPEELKIEESTNLSVKQITIAPDKSRGSLKTRTVMYTTKSPLYGVQIGAFDKLLPDPDFKNLKNVHSFIDSKGVVRYVVGQCVMRSQAENLRKAVIEAGYSDAFIVDINTEEKFNEEVIHPSKKAGGKKEYRVQLGVFRSEIPEELSRIYLTIDGIKETQEEDFTILTSGSFKDHSSALAYKDEMIAKGVPGAFVVSFVNGKRHVPGK